jgi:putative membrane protein
MESFTRTLNRCFLAAALCCIPLGLMAQAYPQDGTHQPDERQSNSPNMSQLSSADKAFVDKAAQGGMAEVELGNLAMQKATNPDVKEFAQRMVHDHSKANQELSQIANREGISVPKKLSANEAMTKARLEKLHGEAFDKAYMQGELQDHKKDIAEFQQERQNGENASVKHFASRTLPTLQSHLKEAETVAPKVNASTSASMAR